MHRFTPGFLLRVTLITGTLLTWSPAVGAQDNCVAFSVSAHAYSPVDDWIGQSWWIFGNAAPLYASELTSSTGYEKSTGSVWIGTEKTTVDFGKGDTFQLITRWITHHIDMNSANAGVGEVTEIGTITNGTGRFANVTGVFFSPGTFGPGMSGDQQLYLWLASRQGTICGLTETLTLDMPAKAAAPRSIPPPARRLR